MSGPFDFDAYGNSARAQEIAGNSHVGDMLTSFGKKPEDRDVYDRAKLQQAPAGSAVVQLFKLLTGG